MHQHETAQLAPADLPLYLVEYQTTRLVGKAPATIELYVRLLHQFTNWLAQRCGSDSLFQPDQLTKTALQTYLAHLEKQGYSLSHRLLVKTATSSFARFLIEDKGLLSRNPASGLQVGTQPLLAPRELSLDQRYILLNLAERELSLRTQALFALGYWVGCRVSDVSWLLKKDVHLTSKAGWLNVGHKGGKQRELDLLNQARKPLLEYLQSQPPKLDSPYFFTSQRSQRLTEAGIHHWFRQLKNQARRAEWEQIQTISYHDLRHDWAHRARAAGWNLEEIAYYLGHITSKGQPAIATTLRYTQASRQGIRTKLKLLGS